MTSYTAALARITDLATTPTETLRSETFGSAEAREGFQERTDEEILAVGESVKRRVTPWAENPA